MRTALGLMGVGIACSGCWCGPGPNAGPDGPMGAGGFGGSFDAGCVPFSEVQAGVGPVGVPADVWVAISFACAPSSVPASTTGVTVSVVDPQNVQVAATASAPATSGRTIATRVGFTPERAGDYTINVKFEPSAGQVGGVFAARAVRDAGFREVPIAASMQDCTTFGLLASGVVVCVSPSSPGLIVGATSIAGDTFAIEGDAVWALAPHPSGTFVERWAPADAGLAKTHEVGPVPFFGTPALTARDGEAHVIKVTAADAGAFTFAGRFVPGAAGAVASTLRPLGPRYPSAVFSAPGHVLVVASPTTNAGSNLLDLTADGGGAVTVVPGVFDPGPTDEGVMWTRRMAFFAESNRTFLGAIAFDAFGVFHVRQLGPALGPVDFGTRLTPHTPVLAFFGGGDAGFAAFPVLLPGGVDVDLLEPGPGFRFISATRTHAFARSDDATRLRIFDR